MSGTPAGATGKLTAWKTTLANLVIEKDFNVRMDMGDLDSLAQSIADNGVERPLNVCRTPDNDATFTVRDGHRRLEATRLAAKKGMIDAATFEIPILIAPKGASTAESLAMMARANDGKPLLPYEQAKLFQRMVEAGTSIAEVCKLVGHSDLYVRQHLDLLTAAPEVRRALEEGRISKTLALNISTQARKGKIDAKALIEKATASKEGKREATLATDAYQARQRAIRVKLDAIRETLAEISTQVREALDEAKMTRAAIKDAKHYNLIRLIGMEAGLRNLVNEHKE